MRLRDIINGVDFADMMEQRMFCFGSDGGDASGAGGQDDKEQKGTTFGVNGVSKTGSTDMDKSIGFTDGAGGQGSNYGALKDATSEQTTAAVAAAKAVAKGGGSSYAQQNAVANALDNYQTGAVNNAGNLTQAGQSLVNKAAEQALAMENTYKAGTPVAAAFGMPADATPMTEAEIDAFDAELNAMLGGNAVANAVATPQNMGAARPASGSLTYNSYDLDGRALPSKTVNFGAVQPLSLAGQVLQNNLTQGVPSYNIDYNTPLGTPVAPSFPNQAETPAEMAARLAMEDANMVNIDRPIVLASDYTPDMLVDSGVKGVGKIPQAPVLQDGQYYMAGVPVTDELADLASATRADIYDALPSPNPSFVDKALGFITGKDPRVSAGEQYGRMLALDGAMIDPETGNISASAGLGTLNLNNDLGMVTYTGMPDPDYTGAYANLVNPPAEPFGGNDEVVPPETNPMTGSQRCPDGYIFDPDLNACRMDTGTSGGVVTPVNPAPSGIYFRQTGLDQAPANLPAGFDFNAANRRFVESYGYRPDFYRKPMSLTGFRKL